MSDLKPCPFCKSGAHTFHGWLWHVACDDCGCKLTGFVTEAEAIEAWNTRAEPMKEIIYCEDCENSHFFYPWRYPGERSTVEVGTCALMAEGVTIERDGYCAFAERREQ